MWITIPRYAFLFIPYYFQLLFNRMDKCFFIDVRMMVRLSIGEKAFALAEDLNVFSRKFCYIQNFQILSQRAQKGVIQAETFFL